MPATLPSGLYKIAFETPSGTEYGVAYLQDGKLRGGDSGMAYVGSYLALVPAAQDIVGNAES